MVYFHFHFQLHINQSIKYCMVRAYVKLINYSIFADYNNTQMPAHVPVQALYQEAPATAPAPQPPIKPSLFHIYQGF